MNTTSNEAKEDNMTENALWIAIQDIQAWNHGTADEEETVEYMELFKNFAGNLMSNEPKDPTTPQVDELEICENCGTKCGASLPYGKDCKQEPHIAVKYHNYIYEALRGYDIPEGFERIFKHLEEEIDEHTNKARIDELTSLFGNYGADGLGITYTVYNEWVRNRIAQLQSNKES